MQQQRRPLWTRPARDPVQPAAVKLFPTTDQIHAARFLDAWKRAKQQKGSFVFPKPIYPGVESGDHLLDQIARLTPILWSIERGRHSALEKRRARHAYRRLCQEAQILRKCEEQLRLFEDSGERPDASPQWIASIAKLNLLQHPTVQSVLRLSTLSVAGYSRRTGPECDGKPDKTRTAQRPVPRPAGPDDPQPKKEVVHRAVGTSSEVSDRRTPRTDDSGEDSAKDVSTPGPRGCSRRLSAALEGSPRASPREPSAEPHGQEDEGHPRPESACGSVQPALRLAASEAPGADGSLADTTARRVQRRSSVTLPLERSADIPWESKYNFTRPLSPCAALESPSFVAEGPVGGRVKIQSGASEDGETSLDDSGRHRTRRHQTVPTLSLTIPGFHQALGTSAPRALDGYGSGGVHEPGSDDALTRRGCGARWGVPASSTSTQLRGLAERDDDALPVLLSSRVAPSPTVAQR